MKLLLVGILIASTMPLSAQGQTDSAKVRGDAQKVGSIINEDKAKTQTYCQILDLSDELYRVDRHKDRKKAEDLSHKIDDLQKKLGPEYIALLEAIKDVNPNSRDGQDIISVFDELGLSCPDSA